MTPTLPPGVSTQLATEDIAYPVVSLAAHLVPFKLHIVGTPSPRYTTPADIVDSSPLQSIPSRRPSQRRKRSF